MHVALVGAEFEENLAVRYLQGALEQAGHRVTSLVFNDAEETERVARELAASGAAVAGFSLVFTYRAREFIRLLKRARELGFRGHCVAGGHFATLHAERLLEDVPELDSVGCGEGELILCALVRHLSDLGAVAGLLWRRGDTLVKNAPAIKPPDLDVLPVPPRKSPFDQYLGIPITNILSSRGCTRACAFCSIAAWHRVCGGPRLRLRAPSRLAEEMGLLYRQGVRVFNFHDDNFVIDDKKAMLERLRDWSAQLTLQGVTERIAFALKCRPDTVDREVFSVLKQMGLFRVFLGVEAGTEESLVRLGRGQSLEDNVRALALLNELDLHTCFNLLVLNPDSRLQDLAGNIAFLREHPHNAMNFCRTEIYAGTPLEKKLREQGRLRGDYWGYDYVIADPQAQLAFDLIYPAFESRNYGDEGLHHLAMQIDYEQQLLQAFFGPHRELRRRVKELIVEVNLNTCSHLERVVGEVPQLATEHSRECFGRALREAVERDNALLGARVTSLLDEIRAAPQQQSALRVKGRWARAAATAGLAATVGLAAAGCKERSHPTEMVAIPTTPASGPPLPEVEPDAASDPTEGLPVGSPGLIKATVSREMLKFLAEKVVPPAIVEFELWVTAEGRVAKVKLYRPALSPDSENALVERARSLRFTDPAIQGRRYLVYFSKEELEKAGADAAVAPPIPTPTPTLTHRTERIPPRPEMAPRPPPTPTPPRPEMAPKPTNK